MLLILLVAVALLERYPISSSSLRQHVSNMSVTPLRLFALEARKCDFVCGDPLATRRPALQTQSLISSTASAPLISIYSVFSAAISNRLFLARSICELLESVHRVLHDRSLYADCTVPVHSYTARCPVVPLSGGPRLSLIFFRHAHSILTHLLSLDSISPSSVGSHRTPRARYRPLCLSTVGPWSPRVFCSFSYHTLSFFAGFGTSLFSTSSASGFPHASGSFPFVCRFVILSLFSLFASLLRICDSLLRDPLHRLLSLNYLTTCFCILLLTFSACLVPHFARLLFESLPALNSLSVFYPSCLAWVITLFLHLSSHFPLTLVCCNFPVLVFGVLDSLSQCWRPSPLSRPFFLHSPTLVWLHAPLPLCLRSAPTTPSIPPPPVHWHQLFWGHPPALFSRL